LHTVAAGGTEPDIFGFKRHHAEFSLIDDPANVKFSDPVPWADRIAFSALIAEFVRFSAGFFDAVDHYFKWFKGKSFQYLFQSSSFA
jgi:hypothetical protein